MIFSLPFLITLIYIIQKCFMCFCTTVIFFRVALSLSFFVRETVETLRLSHISLSFTSSYKVSSKFQSSIFFLLFNSDIATLFMFFYPAYSFFLPVPFRTKLVPFYSACSFFVFKGNNPLFYLVSFYLLCVFFTQNLFQKRHNPCFLLHSSVRTFNIVLQ